MKQLIYSTGVFETELTAFAPEETSYDDMPYVARMSRQRFELRKTSRCLTRYEAEAGDKEYLNQLEELADEATKMLSMNLISAKECQPIVDRCNAFADIYHKAIRRFETECKSVLYVEIADETDRGCHAEYRFNDGIAEGVQPCKIGEPWVIKMKTD